MNSPAVSVVMPVYNGAAYLRQALASLRWQSFANWEAVCVNDGSTDESLAILRRFATADSRFRVLDQPNQGIVAALNAGVRAARAPWIARLDADDLATPERLALQMQFVKQNPRTVLVGSYALHTDPAGGRLGVQEFPQDHEHICRRALAREAGLFCHPSILMSRAAFHAAGGYRHEFEWVEDIDLWLRLLSRGQVANIPLVLLHYRQHEQSVCWNRRAVQHERLNRLFDDFQREHGLATEHSDSPAPRFRFPSSAAGKWARRAASAGNFQTAWRQWKRQAAHAPLSPYTWRVTAETVVRGLGSLLRPSEAPIDPLPDWRRWDIAPSYVSRAA